MASFDKAWYITQTWEGKWVAKSEKGSETEEFVYSEFWGTNYGLTGKYMKDFIGWSKSDRSKFQKMNATEAGNIWRFSRWKWAQCDQIQNQEIANLIFDWSVRRWNSLVKGIAEVLNVPITSIARVIKMAEVGGKPNKNTDGFYVFTSAMSMLINKYPNQSELFDKLKAKRKALDNPRTASIIQRYDSFKFAGTMDKNGYLAALDNKGTSRKSLRLEKQSGVSPIVLIGIFIIGAKILRG